MGVHIGIGQEPELFELIDSQEAGFVQDQDDGAAAFVILGGEHLGGLRDQRGLVDEGPHPRR